MIGACILMTANETRDLMWLGSPIKTIAKFIVHSIVRCCTVVDFKYDSSPNNIDDKKIQMKYKKKNQ